MKLLIDIGNTRLKWALVRDGQFIDSGAMVHDGEPARTIAQLPASKPDAIWISHVIGLTHQHALSEAVRTPLVQIPNIHPSSAGWPGLRNAYRDPAPPGAHRRPALIEPRPTPPRG